VSAALKAFALRNPWTAWAIVYAALLVTAGTLHALLVGVVTLATG
jgi:hypothetical protein